MQLTQKRSTPWRTQSKREAVVWLTPVGATVETPQQDPSHIPQLVQKNKSFTLRCLVIPVGGKVEFPNHDPFFHNVFSLFEGKRFDLGLYESGTTRFVQFDKPGISFIFCNIHEQMSAVVIALATPYYAISDARGDLSLPQCSAGPLPSSDVSLFGRTRRSARPEPRDNDRSRGHLNRKFHFGRNRCTRRPTKTNTAAITIAPTPTARPTPGHKWKSFAGVILRT